MDLVGNETLPGSSGSPGSTSGPTSPPILPWDGFFSGCVAGYSLEQCLGDAALPPITMNDIASFVPTPGRQQMEPDGWAVAGLPTNFFAITDRHVVAGTLLGRPADVRFSPATYHWAYGDGATASTTTKGGTWAALGLPEFGATPTSHVYEVVGDYTITLSIVFTAEYRFDGSAWRPVVGSLTLPANDLHIRVGTAKTVLVERDCLVAPQGPGC